MWGKCIVFCRWLEKRGKMSCGNCEKEGAQRESLGLHNFFFDNESALEMWTQVVELRDTSIWGFCISGPNQHYLSTFQLVLGSLPQIYWFKNSGGQLSTLFLKKPFTCFSM